LDNNDTPLKTYNVILKWTEVQQGIVQISAESPEQAAEIAPEALGGLDNTEIISVVETGEEYHPNSLEDDLQTMMQEAEAVGQDSVSMTTEEGNIIHFPVKPKIH
jgi:hypothetical protein